MSAFGLLAAVGVGSWAAFAGVLGEGGIGFAVGAEAGGAVGDLAAFDEGAADLGDEFSADAHFVGEVAVGSVVMDAELDFDGATALGSAEWETVEEVAPAT